MVGSRGAAAWMDTRWKAYSGDLFEQCLRRMQAGPYVSGRLGVARAVETQERSAPLVSPENGWRTMLQIPCDGSL